MNTYEDLPLRDETALKADGFSKEEIIDHLRLTEEYLALIAVRDSVKAAKDYAKENEIEDELEQLGMLVHFLGKHPSDIPVKTLRHLVHNAPDPYHNDSIENAYRQRITGKANAIRAKCVLCMGGNVSFIRDCPSVNCPTWPFRMGTNPLRGVLPPLVKLVQDAELNAALADEIIDDESGEADANA